MRDKIKRFLSM